MIAFFHRGVIGQYISQSRKLNSAADASKAIASITRAVAHGELGFGEAAELSKLIETYIRAVEATDLEKRLVILEQRFK